MLPALTAPPTIPLGVVLEWQRPALLWGLALPLVLLLLARRPLRPSTVATGTLRLWREVATRVHVDAGRARRRVPAWLALACIALAAGIVAAAEPRPRQREQPRTWTAVLDRAVGLGLPWVAPEAAGHEEPGASARTRGEVALAEALEQLARLARPEDRVRWLAAGREPLLLGMEEEPPAAWRAPVRGGSGGTPEWGRYATPGTLWITDRRPAAEPGGATLVLAGGAAVPGPVAAVGDELVGWSPDGPGETLPRRRGVLVLTRTATAWPGPPLPPLLEGLVRSWARARGLGTIEVQDDAATASVSPDAVLVVEGVGVLAEDVDPPPGARAFRAREPGLFARGVVLPAHDAPRWPGPPAEQALAVRWRADAEDGEGEVPLAAAAPGWVRLYVAQLEPPSGDPAAFALRVAALLDAALLPPPGVVPPDARAAAGSTRVEPGEPPASVVVPAPPLASTLAAWCAALAGLCAFAAMLARRTPSVRAAGSARADA